MICDKDGGGTMDEDECMEILYHRFGKEVRLFFPPPILVHSICLPNKA